MIIGNPLLLGGGGGGDVFAFIIATYPAGSVCTCSDGTKTLTAKDTSGSYVFEIPSAGTWTVSCTDGEQTATENVVISDKGQSESVELKYTLYFIRNSALVSPHVLTLNGSGCSLDGTKITTTSSPSQVVGFIDAVDVTGYSKVSIDYNIKNNASGSGTQWLIIGLSTDSLYRDNNTQNMICYSKPSSIVAGDYHVDLDLDYTGSLYFKVYTWTRSNEIALKDVHLTR